MKPTDFYWGRVLLDSLLFKLTFNAVTGQYTIMVDCTSYTGTDSGLQSKKIFWKSLSVSHWICEEAESGTDWLSEADETIKVGSHPLSTPLSTPLCLEAFFAYKSCLLTRQ